MRFAEFSGYGFSTFAHDTKRGVFATQDGAEAPQLIVRLAADETGDCSAEVFATDGSRVADGHFTLGTYFHLVDPKDNIPQWAIEFSVAGQRLGILTRLIPHADRIYDVRNQQAWSTPSDKPKDLFGAWIGPGAMIATEDGHEPVEWIEAGTRVVTRDRGLQPVKLVLRRHVSLPPGVLHRVDGTTLEATGDPEPIILSQKTPVLLRDPKAELMFGMPEVLAPCHAVANGPGGKGSVTMTSLVFDCHELVMAGGSWVGAWYGDGLTMGDLMPLQRLNVLARLGTGFNQHHLARMLLTERDTKLVFENPDADVGGQAMIA